MESDKVVKYQVLYQGSLILDKARFNERRGKFFFEKLHPYSDVSLYRLGLDNYREIESLLEEYSLQYSSNLIMAIIVLDNGPNRPKDFIEKLISKLEVNNSVQDNIDLLHDMTYFDYPLIYINV